MARHLQCLVCCIGACCDYATQCSVSIFLWAAFGSAGQTAWIGLSDIVQQGKYQWIDGAELIIDKSVSFSVFLYFRLQMLVGQ